MKSRVPFLVAVVAGLLLAAPGVEASRAMPRVLVLPAGQVSACDFGVAALDRSGAVSHSPQRLTFLSGKDRHLIRALALLSARNRTELLSRRSLGFGPLNGQGQPALQGYENRILLWTPDDPGAYLPAEYTLTINLQLTDPAGHPIHAPPTGLEYLHLSQSDIVWSKPPGTPLLTASAVGNDRYLHGRPYLPDLALYDHRARFYEPPTSTFLEPDPLGPVDSPNPYQAFGFDPLNVRDPFGYGIWDWIKKHFASAKDWWSSLGGRAERGAERMVDQALPAAPDIEEDPYGAREAAQEIGVDPNQRARSRAAQAFGAVRELPVEGAGKAARVGVEAGKFYVENKAAEVVLAAGGAAIRGARRVRMAGGAAQVPEEVAAGSRPLRGGLGKQVPAEGGDTASSVKPSTPASAYHYTYERYAASIESEGLRPGTYATPMGDLSPIQAQLELALPPNRGVTETRIRIDLQGLRKSGYEIPKVKRVSNVVRGAGGRIYTMPGGGYEMKFPYAHSS